MLNPSTGTRELAYVVMIDGIEPIMGSDNCEAALVGGWRAMVRKGTFKIGDLAVYFEIDSHVDTTRPEFAFLASKHGNVKTQKYTFGGKGLMISQGLLMTPKELGYYVNDTKTAIIKYTAKDISDYHAVNDNSRFLTKQLNITYAISEDNDRKAPSVDKYKKMAQRHAKLFSKPFFRWMMGRTWGKKILFVFFGHKIKKNNTDWPDGKFLGVKRTDQERCENLPWVLNDKTPFIVTQKCDGSSGTYILARKPFGRFEFYVCSRNVRMLKPTQECFYGEHNYYWEVAQKYDIENKMKQWLKNNPKASFICWQGEICAPGIQGNPHNLSTTHFYCFHWTDDINGRLNIIEAKKYWESYEMEVVPIVNDSYILPDDFEDFKISADGYYNSNVCEGHNNCPREGFVYYKTTDPNFSFKNVSRQYLLNH